MFVCFFCLQRFTIVSLILDSNYGSMAEIRFDFISVINKRKFYYCVCMFIFIFLPIVFDPGEKKLLNKKNSQPNQLQSFKKKSKRICSDPGEKKDNEWDLIGIKIEEKTWSRLDPNFQQQQRQQQKKYRRLVSMKDCIFSVRYFFRQYYYYYYLYWINICRTQIFVCVCYFMELDHFLLGSTHLYSYGK